MTRSCPLCDLSDFLPVVHWPKAMVSANVLYESAAQARNAPAGELRILLCRSCGFVFNAAFDPALVPYGERYENDQSRSERFRAHMQEMAARVRAAMDGTALRAVEVGCGQGQFLRLLLGADPAGDDRAAGFDPSYVGDGVRGCDIYRSYFGPESASVLTFQPNAVISRHVIEHIPDPRQILGAIRTALDPAPHAMVFFETPSVHWIFEHNAFWDLCYEHCSYFTPASLAFAFEVCGFEPRSVTAVFGGQYLWIEADAGRARRRLPPPGEALAVRFSRRIAEDQSRWRETLTAMSPNTRVAVWGAATKGAMFVQNVDPQATLVHCLIDINPMKQNRYIPLTAHPVVDWRSAVANGVSTIIVTNPNYLDEIRAMLGEQALSLEFLPL